MTAAAALEIRAGGGEAGWIGGFELQEAGGEEAGRLALGLDQDALTGYDEGGEDDSSVPAAEAAAAVDQLLDLDRKSHASC